MEFAAIAVVLCVLIIIILNNWRRGLIGFLVWLLFEDFVRKYLGNNMAIYFGKDALVALVYLSYFIAIRREQIRLFRPPFRVPLLLMIWFAVLQILNPGSPSVFFGLMGFKMFFFYVPLLPLGYSLLNSEQDLRRFIRLNLLLVLIISSLGIAQSILGHTFLNPQNMQEDIRELSTLYRTTSTGLISYRPTSVFVSTGRYCNFLEVGWLLVLGFTGYLLFRQRKSRIFAFVVLVVTAAALVLTASRGAFMWEFINTLAFSAAFLWGAPWRTGEVIRVLRAIQRTALGLVTAFILLLFLFPDALKSRLSLYSETLIPNTPASDLVYRTSEYPIANFLIAFNNERWAYGYGIGTSGLGTQYVTRLFHVSPIHVSVESGFGSIIIEQGIVGLILWLIMSAAILFSAWKVVRQLRASVMFPIGFCIFWFALMLLAASTYAGIASYEDFVLNAYLWLLIGILFRLPTIGSPKSEPLGRAR